jgi:uncharacterized membrane protein YkvA (DUF1232 family)
MLKSYMDMQEFFQEYKGEIMSILYILMPIDLVPELFFGVLGLLDDAVVAVILLCLIGFRIYRKIKENKEKKLKAASTSTEPKQKIGTVNAVDAD